MNLMRKISFTAKHRRLEKKLSQDQLAIKVYGDPSRRSHISKLESGKLDGMTVSTLEKLFKALDVEILFKDL